MLGMEPGTSAWESSALNYWVVSPVTASHILTNYLLEKPSIRMRSYLVGFLFMFHLPDMPKRWSLAKYCSCHSPNPDLYEGIFFLCPWAL